MLGFLTDDGPHTEHVVALHAVAAATTPSADERVQATAGEVVAIARQS